MRGSVRGRSGAVAFAPHGEPTADFPDVGSALGCFAPHFRRRTGSTSPEKCSKWARAEARAMTLTVAVQMDPIQTIKIAGDSTFALLLEAQARGHALLHYTPDRLSFRDGRVMALAEPLRVQDVEGSHAALGPPARIDLAGVNVVLMRQDPPF